MIFFSRQNYRNGEQINSDREKAREKCVYLKKEKKDPCGVTYDLYLDNINAH